MRRNTRWISLVVLVGLILGCAPAPASPPTTAPPTATAPVAAAKPAEAAKPTAAVAKPTEPAKPAEAAKPTEVAKPAPAAAPASGVPTTHAELVALAMREGEVRVLSGGAPEQNKAMAEGFQKKYPGIKATVQEQEGTDAYQRFILELQAGTVRDWDITHMATDFYQDYRPFLKKVDLLDLTDKGVLNIPKAMIDPTERNAVGNSTSFQVLGYNKKLVPPDKVPTTWEDMLKPEYKGRKFVLDVRGLTVAPLVAAWGLDKTLEFARGLASQEPIWTRGGVRVMTSLQAGEYSLFLGVNFNTLARTAEQDTTGSIGYKALEPVAVRAPSAGAIILESAKHPNAALLWLEHIASPEGQAVMDEFGPYQSSIYGQGSRTAKETAGLKLSIIDWQHFTQAGMYTTKINEAFGFPTAEVQ